VALVAVLSVLTVLAVLAASFAVLIQLDVANANSQVEIQRLNLLLESGMNHAVAVLQQAQAAGEKISTLPRGSLRQAFGEYTTGVEAHDARQARDETAGRWIPVVNSRGIVEGRYRVAVEDEAAKVNLNTAFLMDKSKGSGWLPGEVALAQASGLPTQVMERIVHFRYGPNRVPGARGDDDKNNVLLMSDGIDNNANGIIDEDDEGVEDPGEYSPYYPMGDDRRITSISEALSILLGGPLKLTLDSRRLIQREVPRRATLYSIDLPGSSSLPDAEPADVNVVNTRQARRLIGRANMVKPFGGTQRDLDQLAVNIVDYRDQNHVLSTHGSLYGVEAINFNELLANDGTEARSCAPILGTDARVPSESDFSSPNQKQACGVHALFRNTGATSGSDSQISGWEPRYGKYATGVAYDQAWDIEIDRTTPTRVRLLGPAKRASGEDLWNATRMRGYEMYRRMRQGTKYTPRNTTGNPGNGHHTYQTFSWPPNMFRNWYITGGWTGPDSMAKRSYTDPDAIEITASDAQGNLTLSRALQVPAAAATNPEPYATRAVLWGWGGTAAPQCARPRIPLMMTFNKLKQNTYYLPMLNFWKNHARLDRQARAGFAEWNELWSDNREPIDNKLEYGGDGPDATPIRTYGNGNLDLFVISGRDVVCDFRAGGLQYSGANSLWGMTFVRPEVIELMNVSARAVSLRGWTLTFNSGSIVNDIGMIDYGKGYSLNRTGARDPNPMIMPNGYFYLVNNTKLFNADFGSKTPTENWGNNASQYVPIWEIPNSSWGVQYNIERAESPSPYRILRIHVKNENFRRNEFRGETVEFQNTFSPEGQKGCAHGCRYMIVGNDRASFEIEINESHDASDHYEPTGWSSGGVRTPGVNVMMILGMPAKGGVVSMTLKNEYKQVVARTVRYAYVDQEPDRWYGQSTEKTDPTHYNWIVRRTPSISGRPELAANYSLRGKSRRPVEIKDGPYVSVGELQRVRIGRDFENIGDGRSGVRQRDTMAGLASVFGSSTVRLEACDERAERSGWHSALLTVSGTRPGGISASDAAWEIDQWRQHTVRFMTGRLRGETFPVFNNTRNTLQLSTPEVAMLVRSSPGRQPLNPSIGDVFTVGPGYASGMCYARRPEQKGEWTWRQRIGVPGTYHLYIFGLSDSISTTEFLEENDNAALDIEVWNYEKNEYDMLARNQKYGKDDGIYAGQITPAHASAKGDFKLRLTARGVSERGLVRDAEQSVQAQRRQQSGYAWFNYAVLTPMPVPGRVNANTASPRLLASLPGITPALAKDIFDGTDTGGRAALKPYATIGDLIKVRGMTPEIFERSANMFSLDSGAYTIDVQAQTVKDINTDGVFDEKKEPVQGERRKRLVVRTGMGSSTARMVDILEQYTP